MKTMRRKARFVVLLTLGALLVMQSFVSAYALDVDYDSLSREELQLIIDSANDAIRRNHSVSSSDSDYLESKTKSIVGKLVSDQDSSPSWRWFDWSYSRNWHDVTVVTEVKINGTWLPLEVCYTDKSGDFEMVYTKLDDEVISGDITDTTNNNAPDAIQGDRSNEEAENDVSVSDTVSANDSENPENNTVIAQKGDRNDTVKDIQSILIQLGYLSGKADGDFGNKTKEAVESFQKAHGFNSDGIVTESVYNAIQNEFNSLPKEQQESTPEEEQYISISATKLNDAYQENEVSADLQYTNQIIDVSGKVGSVSKTFGTIYVRLDADDYGIYTVACAMRKDQEQAVGTLKTGQKITIRGKCTGLSLIEVSLNDCKIIK